MWRDVAPALARRFTVVCADLRGYGQSGCPDSTADHAPVRQAGHGARHGDGDGAARIPALRRRRARPGRARGLSPRPRPSGSRRPARRARRRADRGRLGARRRSLRAGLLALVAPGPARAPSRADAGGGSRRDRGRCARRHGARPAAAFPPAVRAAYVEALRDAAHAHAICEEYRAAATIDREHDRADRASGRRIGCPLLALWSARGALDTWYVGGIRSGRACGRPGATTSRAARSTPATSSRKRRPSETADALSRFFAAS